MIISMFSIKTSVPCLAVSLLLLLQCSAPCWAATLESPGSDATLSGLGFISGWKCDADNITVRINGGGHVPVTMYQPRADTRSACGASHNGFFTPINWALLDDGEHTIVAYDDGVRFASSTFTVVTTGEEFLSDAEGECIVPNFPAPGESGRFVWNESTQHLELAHVGRTRDADDEQSVTLYFAYRHSQTVDIEQEKTVSIELRPLTGSGAIAEIMTDDVRELTLGDMAVEVQVYPHAVLLHVADNETKRPITTLNYEPTTGLQNLFGGHGFTGLHYVYHPRSDAELQFWAAFE